MNHYLSTSCLLCILIPSLLVVVDVVIHGGCYGGLMAYVTCLGKDWVLGSVWGAGNPRGHLCVCAFVHMSARIDVCICVCVCGCYYAGHHVSVGVCVIPTNPADMNEWRQTRGLGSHGIGQGLLQGMWPCNTRCNPAHVFNILQHQPQRDAQMNCMHSHLDACPLCLLKHATAG